MKFSRRATGNPSKMGILSAAFHPPTRAHLGLASAALRLVDEVVFVLPLRFPHKEYELVGLEDRLKMLLAATADQPQFSVAVTDGGLFIDIARECRQAYGPGIELWFLCGRDAAERIVNWDYGEPGVFRQQLEEYGLLVADRQGGYDPPAAMRDRIRRLPVEENFDDVSATKVRENVRTGQEWAHLVPSSITEQVKRLYEG
jgi:nicotinate-nucleotide adenylyltransferase